MRNDSCEVLKHRGKIEARSCPHQAIVVHLFSSFHAFALLLMVHISHDKSGVEICRDVGFFMLH